jgi:hypothetical protein
MLFGVPLKAILYIGLMQVLSAYFLQIYHESLSAKASMVLRNQLTSWSFLNGIRIWYRLTVFIVTATLLLMDLYGEKKDSVLVVNNIDTTTRRLPIKELNPFYAFTIWCWTLEMICFGLLLCIELDIFNLPWLIEAAQIAFELALSFAFLVTTIVTFVLYPTAVKENHDMDLFFQFRVLMMHNANLLFMIVELLLCPSKFNFAHFPFAMIFGLSYVVWSWYVAGKVGYFLYFFINYNYKHVLLSYTLLILTLISYFGLSGLISHLVDPVEHFWSVPIVFAGSLYLCKFIR